MPPMPVVPYTFLTNEISRASARPRHPVRMTRQAFGLWEGGCGPVTQCFGGHGFQTMGQIQYRDRDSKINNIDFTKNLKLFSEKSK
jgi:hypothetical protein